MDQFTASRIAIRCIRYVYEDMLDHGQISEEEAGAMEEALFTLLDTAPDSQEDVSKIPDCLKLNYEV